MMRIPKIPNLLLGHVVLIAIWLAAYKSADLFGFFRSFSSLWFLPAGVTLAIVLAVPKRFLLAPLIANWLLAVPQICWLLGIPFTNYRDPLLHGLRLYLIYGGLGLLLRYGIAIRLPVGTLGDSHWKFGLTLCAAGLAALSGVSLHAFFGNFPWEVGWEIIRPWAVGDAIGAIIVPPVLVPLLMVMFQSADDQKEQRQTYSTYWQWPSLQNLGLQAIVILMAFGIGFFGPKLYPDVTALWYVILLPPVFFALQGGIPSAATSVFLSTMLAPPTAHFLEHSGDKLSLQFLLLVSSLIGLTIGAAISDRKRAFDRVVDHERELEQQVAERTEQLEQANQFQRHLIRSMGHDLRQPVQSLNMMLEGLSLELKERPEAKSLEQAKSVGRSASDFIDKVLTFARRDAGQVDVDLTQTSMQETFGLLSATFQPIAAAKRVALDFQPSSQWVLTDQTLLIEALSNLIDNAVRLSAEGQSVTVSADIEDQKLIISVADEIANLTASTPNQTGFGLEIVQQVCALLGAEFQQLPNKASIILPCKNS